MQHSTALHATRRTLFAFLLWLSLGIALLCALAPGGLPLTRAFGSAFSPSTVEVALGARSARPEKSMRIERDDGSAPPTALIDPRPLPLQLELAHPATLAAFALWHTAPILSEPISRRTRSGEPRAPPHL